MDDPAIGGGDDMELQAPAPAEETRSVQCFGRKRKAVALCYCKEAKEGKGIIKVNGYPLELLQPSILRYKVYEAILVVGAQRFQSLNLRIRVKGGGPSSQIYAIRQA